MNAPEARQRLTSRLERLSKAHYDIDFEIERAIHDGFSNILIPFNLSKQMSEDLSVQGFRVDRYPIDDRVTPHKTVVSW